MIEARAGHTATLLPGGKVLVAGSAGSSGAPASAELYDPGKRDLICRYQPSTDQPEPLRHGCASACHGLPLVTTRERPEIG